MTNDTTYADPVIPWRAGGARIFALGLPVGSFCLWLTAKLPARGGA